MTATDRRTASEHMNHLRTEQRALRDERDATPRWKWRKRRDLAFEIHLLGQQVIGMKFLHFNHLYGAQ